MNIEASAVEGMVTFIDVPLNWTGEPYTVKETVAPPGHTITETELSVTVEYNEDKNGVVVTIGWPDESFEGLVNTPQEIDFDFLKTGLNGSPLPGGSFRLSGTDYLEREFEKTVSADSNGIVAFTGIQLGEYTIEELDPPSGYLMPADPLILTVSVDYNEDCSGLEATIRSTEEGALEVISYSNTKALGDISFMKVDYRNQERLLSGGRFELSGTDYEGGAVLMTAVSENGIVTFRGVPIDDGHGYLIKDLSPPRGYRLTKTVLEASVQYNDDKTGVVVLVSEEFLTNRRSSGGGGGGDDPGEDPEGDPGKDPEDPDSLELDKDPGGKGGNLPKTGGIAPSFYMLLAGLVLVILGLILARCRHKAQH